MNPFQKGALIALAVSGALIAPAAASAKLTTTVTDTGAGKALNVAGDADGDLVSFAARNGVILLNGAPTVPPVPADGTTSIVVDTAGGGDTIGLAGLAATDYLGSVLFGGAGGDAISGGGAADLLLGQAGADALDGRGGDDELHGDDGNDELDGGDGHDIVIGGLGTDAVRGGEGDDQFFWFDGDGDETERGGDGTDTVTVFGSGQQANEITVGVGPADVRIARTNLDPFTLDATADKLVLSVGDGDDRVTMAPGLGDAAVNVVAGAGDDTITGSEEPDDFEGGPGNDTLAPGAGADTIVGAAGDDVLLARDGVADVVDGGDGTDTAQADAVDAITGVERLDPAGSAATPPPSSPDTAALLPAVGKTSVVRRHGRRIARVPVVCPVEETGGCRTTFTLTRKRARLGATTVALAPGQRATVSIRLTRAAARLARHHRLAARLAISSSDAAGNVASGAVSVRLRLPR